MTEPGVIEAEPVRRCMACGGGPTETRPYGPGGKEICFNCFARMPEWEQEAKARFKAFIDGEPYNSKVGDCDDACIRGERACNDLACQRPRVKQDGAAL